MLVELESEKNDFFCADVEQHSNEEEESKCDPPVEECDAAQDIEDNGFQCSELLHHEEVRS